jgi:hypothetical protein
MHNIFIDNILYIVSGARGGVVVAGSIPDVVIGIFQ